MKLYAINYDFNKPTPQQIYVGTNSEYKVGIKATRNGTPVEIAPSTATLNLIGTSTFISADASTYNGYVTFPMVTLDAEKFERYGLDVDGNEVQDFSLAVKVNKVDVGEIGGVGGSGITSVSWTDIEDRPTDLGDFTNEPSYITSAQVEPYSATNFGGYATKAVTAATMNGFATNDMITPPKNLLTFAFLSGVPTVVKTSYAPWTLSKWDGTDLDEPVTLEFGYYDVVKVKVGFVSKTITVQSFAWVYRNFNGGYADIIKAEEDQNGLCQPTGIAKSTGEAPSYLAITLSNDGKSIETVDGQSDVVTCTRTSTTRQLTTQTLMYADEVAAAISAATSTFVTASAMASAISAATSEFVTASAMESYVDAQIGAVLSSNF